MEARRYPNGVIEVVRAQPIALPGELVLLLTNEAVVTLGDGLRHVPGAKTHRIRLGEAETANAVEVSGEAVVATRRGTVSHTLPSPTVPARYAIVHATATRYYPRQGDPVVGTVLRVMNSTYVLNINSAGLAALDSLAFDGATKASRPRLKVGDHVFCHVERTGDGVLEVSCRAPGGVEAKGWMTGESVFGSLLGGEVLSLPCAAAHALYFGINPVLSMLGELTPFEAAVGLNGRVWVASRASENAERISRKLVRCVFESPEKTAEEIFQLIQSHFGFSIASSEKPL